MELDLNYVFKDLNGSKIVEPNRTEPDENGKEKVVKGKELTLKIVCGNALTVPTANEKDLAVEKKLMRGDLAMTIYKEKGKVNLSAEEIVELKKVIGNFYGPLIIAQAFKVLDPPKKERSKIPGKKNK